MAPNTINRTIAEDVNKYFEDLRIKLGFRMSYGFLIIFVLLMYAYYYDSFISFLTMGVGVAISLFCVFSMHYSRNYQLVFIIYSISGVLVTSYALIFFHETIHIVDMLWMLAGVCLAFFSIGRKFAFALLILSLIAITIFVYHSLNINIQVVQPRSDYQKFSLVLEMIIGFALNFYFFELFTKLHKYSDQKLREANAQLIEQNAQILLQNEEKTVLVKEIHHRVKNNLQIVVSLLRLQKSEIENETIKNYFQESINRIMAMSLIHQKLYQNESLSQVKFEEYVCELLTTLISTDSNNRIIEYSVHSEVENITLKPLIPMGLIINELATNSIKHAFRDSLDCEISIEINHHSKTEICLTYKDNGTWKEPQSNSTFGLMLLDTLIDQLSGTMTISKRPEGTEFCFIIPMSL